MKARNLNCDVLRIIAFSFVICVHSLLYTGFYKQITEGSIMLIFNILRCLFIICVPLFIILTGYLMNNKELNKKYILGLKKVLITYLLCSIACAIVISLIEHRRILSFTNLFGIFNFSTAPYSWYVELYIGLYLVIPFLNILWKNLNTKKHKQYLLIILFILFILPTFVNIFRFDSVSWWLNPASLKSYNQIMPAYWCGVGYPIFYYFVGCYLKDFKINLSFKKNIILLICCLVLFGTFNFYRFHGYLFQWTIFVGFYSFEAAVISILVANLILNHVKINVKSDKVKKIIVKISNLTFGAYLLSAIFDNLYYDFIFKNDVYLNDKLIMILPTILLVIVSSLGLSFIISLIESLINKYLFKY